MAIKVVGEWIESLLGCPSQCYLDVKDEENNPYVLYLRWRWDDPWAGRVYKTARLACNFVGLYVVKFNRGTRRRLDRISHSQFQTVDTSDDKRSPDLFSLYSVNFKEDELDRAKAKIVELADEWLSGSHEW